MRVIADSWQRPPPCGALPCSQPAGGGFSWPFKCWQVKRDQYAGRCQAGSHQFHPGRTRSINFFEVRWPGKPLPEVIFADLPGYGYAKLFAGNFAGVA